MSKNKGAMDLKTKYEYKSMEVGQKITKLKKILKKHNRYFERNPKNWGYLGDLINLDNKLDELIHFTRM